MVGTAKFRLAIGLIEGCGRAVVTVSRLAEMRLGRATLPSVLLGEESWSDLLLERPCLENARLGDGEGERVVEEGRSQRRGTIESATISKRDFGSTKSLLWCAPTSSGGGA